MGVRDRLQGKRRYRKLFVLSVEGRVTEPQYFKMSLFKSEKISIEVIKAKHPQPNYLLEAMKNWLKKEDPRGSYEAWLVIDRDDHKKEDIDKCYKWSQEKENYGLALSNPNFEYWLLLHFEDGSGVNDNNIRDRHIKKHMPDYDKAILKGKITIENVLKAIEHAKERDKTPCDKLLLAYGCTTVYKLVEKIINSDM